MSLLSCASQRALLPYSLGLALSVTSVSAICDGVPFLANHDGSFELGYEWICGDADEGAFAEGFSASGTVCGVQFTYCITVWINTRDVFVFVWDSYDGHPGAIIAMQAGQVANVRPCPDLRSDEVQITASVNGDFFVGVSQCSSDWPMMLTADGDGPASGDQCWINRYGTWSRVNEVWPYGVRALSLGVYLEETQTPAVPETWGAIKGLFRK